MRRKGHRVAASFSARVLVAAERPAAAGALAARLDRLGFSTTTAAGDGAARLAARGQPVDVALLDAADRPIEEAAALARAMRFAAAPRLLPVVVIADPQADARGHGEAFDAVMRAPAHPVQVAARLNLVLRVAIMEDEARLRAMTLAHRGVVVDLGAELEPGPLRALYVGQPTPFYLGLAQALQQAGGHISCAFSSFTAFDCLHERDFDAVVLNALTDLEPALSIAAAMRRNTRLVHLPALLFVDLERFKAVEDAFDRGVSDLLPAAASPCELGRRIVTLARERRRREALKAAFSRIRAPDVADPATGLATPAFFAEHLDAMARRARQLGRPLSVLVLRAEAPREVSAAAREDALRQFGTIVRHLVRAEDLAARLEPEIFVVAMPGALRAAAEGATRRLEAVGEHTAFTGGAEDDPFQLRVLSAFEEMAESESGRGVLARAVTAFGARWRAG